MQVLHLAPHPDDEVLGAGATLLALKAAGHAVTNLAVSLGRRPDRERRRGELEAACEELGIRSEVLDPPLDMSAAEGDDLGAAGDRLTAILRERTEGCDLLISPSPNDGHPGHELVGRAAVETVRARGAGAPRLWLWGLWGPLAEPTTITAFDEPAMEHLAGALQAHRSQLERNDYGRLLRAKATVDAVLGPERVLGFGARRLEHPFAELTRELVPSAGGLLAGAARVLDPDRPFAEPGSEAG